MAVAVDGATNVYVLNRANGTNGYVLEFNANAFMFYGGQSGTEGSGVTIATHLTNATAMALDGLTNLYVTCFSNTVMRITPAGVSSVVGVITNDGVNLRGIAVMDNGQLALTDAGNNGIWLMNLGMVWPPNSPAFMARATQTGRRFLPLSIIRKTSPRPTAAGWSWPTDTTTRSK